ncbi:pre-rRNA-processing protein TSR1 homolog isoform X2 [Athalia rosae]|uniref:pre-rRNA-processing protein TSR1 homolog isoform X2 n=1 Tax=Athalia rosae TaxID=37344 RepID=UPI002033B839|nr:pre-rRNA-processing protein TSR1 homolog isoform X2 [Athalia rosae]
MGIEKQDRHRSGVFKQSNKLHKTGRHRSKGSIDNEVKGKVASQSMLKRACRELRKEERRNQSQQIRKKKREEVLTKKRSLGGSLAAPLLVAVIPLNQDFDPQSALSLLTGTDEAAIVSKSPTGVIHIGMPRFKQRFSFIFPSLGDTFANLDAAKIADSILFLVPAIRKSTSGSTDAPIDNWGEEIMTAMIAQGLPSVVVAVMDLETIHPKKWHDSKQQVQKLISKWLPDEKVMPLEKTIDALNVLRRLGLQKRRSLSYRDNRPHLLAENVTFKTGDQTMLKGHGTLEVTGYLRGSRMSVNGLVHIPGFGEFQMSQIDAPQDIYPLEKKRTKDLCTASDFEMGKNAATRILERVDSNIQESLQSEYIPDPLDAEQTWPTSEELADAEIKLTKTKVVKLLPKGTSSYQAAWIPDVDDEELNQGSESGSDEGSDEGMAVDAEQPTSMYELSENESGDENDYETMTISSDAALDDQRYDQQMDMQEERQAIIKFKEAKLDALFPDEKDTPQNVPAREYFAKYRGLESFRTSPWDPKENLPADYARIFQFENFDRTRKRILKKSWNECGPTPGWYITIHVTEVNQDLYKAYITKVEQPLILFGLLPHEHKMSVLNVVLKRTTNNSKAIESKTRLLFQCGFRKFYALPIFSQHTNGSKHKYERYFHPGSTVVASMYAPVTFPPCPVMCYIENQAGDLELIATGSVLSVNPDRLVIKRVVLSGYPFKIHKRSAVVRFMFFNREDINWFKPVQLRTKHGRRGHIKEPLGTHGHMKCVFDGQLKSQDTVLMNLYKRVFPTWTYDPYVLATPTKQTDDIEMA